jgi:hypothetical protein
MLQATIPQSTEMTSGTSKSPCHRVFPQSSKETGCYGDGWVPICEGICGRRCFSKALHEWQVEAVTLPMTALAPCGSVTVSPIRMGSHAAPIRCGSHGDFNHVGQSQSLQSAPRGRAKAPMPESRARNSDQLRQFSKTRDNCSRRGAQTLPLPGCGGVGSPPVT